MKRIVIFACSSIMPIVSMQVPELFVLKEKTVYTTNLFQKSMKKIIDLASFPDRNEFISVEYEDKNNTRLRLRSVGNKLPTMEGIFTDVRKVACTHNKTFAIIENVKSYLQMLIRVFEVNSENEFLEKATFGDVGLSDLSWSPQGTMLACNIDWSNSNYYYVVENKETSTDGEELLSRICIKNEYYLGTVAWSNEESKYVTGGRYYNETGKQIDEYGLTIHTLNSDATETVKNVSGIRSVVIKTSSKNHCAFMDKPRWTHAIGFFNIEQKQINILKSKETQKIKALCFDQTGNYLAAGNTKGEIAIWDTQSLNIVCTHSTQNEINALAWSNDGKELIVGFDEGSSDLLVGYKLKKIIKDKN